MPQHVIGTKRKRQTGPAAVPDAPKPPRGLSAASKRVWKDIAATYVLTTTEWETVHAGLKQLDISNRAAEQAKKIGPTIETGPNMIRENQAAKVSRQALGQWLQVVRTLGLREVEAS